MLAMPRATSGRADRKPAVDLAGNVYGGENGSMKLMKYVKD